MPHGTGHHHVHHNGHHHHHHGGWNRRHRHTQFGYYGGPTWYYYRRRPVTWIASSIIITILIIISACLTLRYTVVSDYTADDDLEYAPTDTLIIPVTNAFCQRLELSVDDYPYGYAASLSIVDSRPTLTGKESFSLEETYIDDYTHYYYYLYPGSNFSLSACLSEGSTGVTFSLIKGHKNFDHWVNNFHIAPTKDTFTIDALCSIEGRNNRAYHIQDEDYYYLVFDGSFNMQFNLNMTFNRTFYKVDNNSSVADHCVVSTFGDTCSVGVPLVGKTAFLEVTPQSGQVIDWTIKMGLETTCVPRVWMYAVIALSILVCLLAIFVPLVVCVVKLWCKKKPTAVATVVNADNAPLLGPPPANPYLQQPEYGSNDYTAPPVYKP